MISYLRGELADIEADKIVVDVGGVGYGVFMPGSAIEKLPKVGNTVRIYTYLSVKEDAMQLYGFLSKDALRLFKLVISVSGIGPKGGLAILSQMSPDELRFAVAAKDAKAISKAPGIGKKTAEKLILELQDKLSIEETLEHLGEDTEAVQIPAGQSQQILADAAEALIALGYGSTEAMKAVRQVEVKEDTTVEAVLKMALKYLF